MGKQESIFWVSPTRIYQSIALALFCVATFGCDSGYPTSEPVPNAIVGTWTLQSATLDTYATVSQSQTALDLFAPAEGALNVEGAVSASIRYLDQRYSNSFGDGTLTGYSFSSVPESAVATASVRFAVTPSGSAVLSVHGADGNQRRAFYVEDPWEPTLFSLGADTIRVSRARYVDLAAGNGEAVFVEGSLVLPRRPLEAGRETLLSRRALNGYVADGYSHTFRPDGTYRQNTTYGSRAGTWALTEDGVVIEVDGASALYRFEIAGSLLTLARPSAVCPTSCPFDVRRYYDLVEGTVEEGRVENVFELVRSAP